MLLIIFVLWWEIFPYYQRDKCLSGKNPFFVALLVMPKSELSSILGWFFFRVIM